MARIERIIFFTEEGYELSRIDFCNGKTKITNKKGANKYVKKLLIQEDACSIEELLNDKVYFMSIEEMESTFKEKRKSDKESSDEEKRSTEKIFLAIKLFAMATLIAISVKLGKTIKDTFFDSDVKKESSILPKEENMEEIVDSYSDSSSRTNFVKAIIAYLQRYNGVVSHQYYEEGKGALAHTWDEVEIQKLMFNDYNEQQLINIYGNYKIDRDKLFNDYLMYIKEETQAHIIQGNSLCKDMLFESDEARFFYDKFESYVINYNRASNNDDKRLIAEEFFKTIRRKFDFDDYDTTKIKSYYLSITPIVNAMNLICADKKDVILSEDELGYFNDMFFEDIVNNKINNIAAIVNSVNSDDDNYQKLKEAAIEKLSDDKLYDIYENRDITDYAKYKKNIIDVKREEDKTNKEENTTEVTVDNNDSAKTDNENNKTMDSGEKKKKKKTKSNKNNKKKKKTKKKAKVSDGNIYDIPVETDDVVLPTIVNNNDNIDTDIPVDNNSTDNISDEVINNSDDAYDYINTDDSVKDITTDPTGAVDSDTPLPDPNADYSTLSIEEKATLIVEYWANNNEDYNNKILVKTR